MSLLLLLLTLQTFSQAFSGNEALALSGIAENLSVEENVHQPVRSALKFRFAPAYFNSLRLDNTGAELLHPHPTFGFEGGVSFYQKLYRTWGINAGMGWGIIPWMYSYKFEIPTSSIFELNPDIGKTLSMKWWDYTTFSYISFPLSIQYSIEKIKKTYIFEAGARINYMPEYLDIVEVLDVYYINDSINDALLFDGVLDNYEKRSYFSYFTKAGIQVFNAHGNTHALSIVLHYGPRNVAEGEYKFYNLPFESGGKMFLKTNYIGLEYAYGLNLDKGTK